MQWKSSSIVQGLTGQMQRLSAADKAQPVLNIQLPSPCKHSIYEVLIKMEQSVNSLGIHSTAR